MDAGHFDPLTAGAIFALVGWAAAMHLLFFIFNYTCGAPMIDEPELKAVVIQSSQKTLPVSAAVIGLLPEAAGDQGLMIIACIVSPPLHLRRLPYPQ